MTTPIRICKHSAALLNAAGFTCEHVPASWQDIGGPESGPKLVGGPAYEVWSCGDQYIIVQDGEVEEYGTNIYYDYEVDEQF